MKELNNLIKIAIDNDRKRTEEQINDFQNEFIDICGKDVLVALFQANFVVISHTLSCSFALENKKFFNHRVLIRFCGRNIKMEIQLNDRKRKQPEILHVFPITLVAESNSLLLLMHLNNLNTSPYISR